MIGAPDIIIRKIFNYGGSGSVASTYGFGRRTGPKTFFQKQTPHNLNGGGLPSKKRAEEINSLMEKNIDEISNSREGVSGNIRIGCGKLFLVQFANLRRNFLWFIVSCTARILAASKKSWLKVQPEPPENYSYIELAHKDIWIMRKDSPLANLDKICAEDLNGLPLIISQQALGKGELESWFGNCKLNVVATYTLIYNASLMSEEGVGYVLSLDNLLNLGGDSKLIFRPLSPLHICKNFFIWKKNQIFSRAASLLREKILGCC